MKILLTGARAPSTLDLARLFHAEGHKVFLADSCRFPLSKASKAVCKTYQVPEPKANRTAFIQSLISIIQDERIDLLIPTCEEAFYISQALTELQIHCRVFVDDFQKLARLHDKYVFSTLTQGMETTTPETHLLQSQDDIDSIVISPELWVLKPVFSRFAAYTLIKPDKKAISRIDISPACTWVAQRYIEGMEYSTYSVAQEGELLAHSAYYSSYRAGKGSGIYFNAAQQPAILAFVTHFVKKMNYTGQIAFDFILTPNNETYVLECNPRATSGIHLFSKADHLPDAFFESPDCLIQPGTQVKKMLSLVMPLYAFASGRSCMKVFQDMMQASDPVFTMDDPLPFLYQFRSFWEIVQKSIAKGIPLTQAATADLEWNGD